MLGLKQSSAFNQNNFTVNNVDRPRQMAFTKGL